MFADIPIQMCHFHQVAIITRYLTRKSKLEAGKELREIILSLTKSNKKEKPKEILTKKQRIEILKIVKTKSSFLKIKSAKS